MRGSGQLGGWPRGTWWGSLGGRRRRARRLAALGMGLGRVLMLGILGWSFEQSLVSTLTRRYAMDLVVTSPFAAGGHRTAPLSAQVVREIQRVPGVATAAGEHLRTVHYGDELILAVSYDANSLVDRRGFDWLLDAGATDAFQAVAEGKSVAVSRSFADLHDTPPGDTIQLTTMQGMRTFKVTAVTSGVPQSAILMTRDLYRRLWNDDFVTWIYVVVAEGNDPRVVSAAIAGELGQRYRLRVVETRELIDHFANQARQAFGLQYVMAAITLLLVLIGIGDTL